MEKIWLNVFRNEKFSHNGSSAWINMGYLTAALKKNLNVDVQVNFYMLDEVDLAISDAIQSEPSIIGLTVLQFNCHACIEFSEKIKEKLPKVHITMGNTFASTYSSYLLQNYRSIDSIVIGEGEFSFVELCKYILNGMSLNQCKGIYYRNGIELCETEKRELHDNLDDYPFPDRSFCENKVNVFGVLGSRGCYGNCTFCTINTLFKGKVRIRSIVNILDEIELLKINCGAKYINFYDSTFCIDRKDSINRLEQFYYGLLKKDLDINFSINLRTEQIDNRLLDVIIKLKDVGLDCIYFGIEAGNNEDLSIYGKPANVQNHLDALNLLRENMILSDNYDVSVDYGFINYHPYSKIENVKKNIQFLRDSGLFFTFRRISSRFLNYGDCELSKKIEKDGLLLTSPGEPIKDPLAYRFVDPKIQTIYEINKEYAEQFKQLDFPQYYEWISAYRRWKKFYSDRESKYTSIFNRYIKDQTLITQFVSDIMLDVVDKVDKNHSIDDIIKEHSKIISNKIDSLKDDYELFVATYQKLNIDLFKKNELIVYKVR